MLFKLFLTIFLFVLAIFHCNQHFPVHYIAVYPSNDQISTNLLTNTKLQNIKFLAKGKIKAPESILIDEENNLLYAAIDSALVKIDLKTEQLSDFVALDRPLGLSFDNHKDIIVADAISGLLKVSTKDKSITILTKTDGEGNPLGFTDDLDISKSGDIYFSDASKIRPWWDGDHWDVNLSSKLDVASGIKTGKLLVYDPKHKTTKVLAKEISFANGVALSKNEDFVLVCETGRARVLKYHLQGENKGKIEVLVNLPGYPDNIRRSTDGSNTFWVAIFAPKSKALELIHPYPFIKKLAMKLPEWARPKEEKTGLVIQIDENGKIVKSLSDPDGTSISFITNVVQSKNKLYFGSLRQDFIGVYEDK